MIIESGEKSVFVRKTKEGLLAEIKSKLKLSQSLEDRILQNKL